MYSEKYQYHFVFLKHEALTQRDVIQDTLYLTKKIKIDRSLATQLFATNSTQADAIFTCANGRGNVNEITRDLFVSSRQATYRHSPI